MFLYFLKIIKAIILYIVYIFKNFYFLIIFISPVYPFVETCLEPGSVRQMHTNGISICLRFAHKFSC